MPLPKRTGSGGHVPPTWTAAPLLALLLLAACLGSAHAQAPATDPHGSVARPDMTSATLALALATPTGDDYVDFKLLEATRIGREPPPNFLKRLRAMDGRTVRIRGFMVPFDSLTDMKNCMIMANPVGCFFCSPPAPNQVVLIRLATKDKTPFIPEPVDVQGTLSLWKPDSKDEGHKQFLFILDAATVKKAE